MVMVIRCGECGEYANTGGMIYHRSGCSFAEKTPHAVSARITDGGHLAEIFNHFANSYINLFAKSDAESEKRAGETESNETEPNARESGGGESCCDALNCTDCATDYEALYYMTAEQNASLKKKVKKLKKKVARLKTWGRGYMDKLDKLKEYATRSVACVGKSMGIVLPTESAPDEEYYRFLGQCPNCGAKPVKWWEAFDNNKMECPKCHFVLLFDDNGNTSEPCCGQCGTEKIINRDGNLVCPKCAEKTFF